MITGYWNQEFTLYETSAIMINKSTETIILLQNETIFQAVTSSYKWETLLY